MVVLSFSVEKLWPKLWDGSKTRSMRPAMKNEKLTRKWLAVYNCMKNGMKPYLQLWWKSRSPESQYLFTVPLKSIQSRFLGALLESEWRADGFSDSLEGLQWFSKQYNVKINDVPNFHVWLIEWECNNCRQCVFQSRCKKQTFPSQEGIDYLKWGTEILCPNFSPVQKPFHWRTIPEIFQEHRGFENDPEDPIDEIAELISETTLAEELELYKEEVMDRSNSGIQYRFQCSHCGFIANYFHAVTRHMYLNKSCRCTENVSPCYPILIHQPPGAPIP